MYRILFACLWACLLAAPAVAQREGGETIDDAVPITDFFFTDSGTTCDNVDDYDEACPTGSLSPDVVYRLDYAPCTFLAVDLYGSAFDTKVYLYDDQLTMLACNDDFYIDGTSRVEYLTEYGGPLYIVVDGANDDCGAYVMAVNQVFLPPPYPVVCPADARQETEPPLIDGYVDAYNGGCLGADGCFSTPTPAAGETWFDFCGTLGWFHTDGLPHHDSDWFQVLATGEEITWTVDAQYAGTVCKAGLLDGCPGSPVVLDQMVVGEGQLGTLILATEPGQVLTLWLYPDCEERPLCFPASYDYAFAVDGVSGVVPVDQQSWGTVKSLYR